MESTQTIIVIAVFSLFMFFLAFKDQASLNEGVHSDYKSLIVSTGVLGTFFGIFWGLWEFNTSDIAGSVPALLEGLKLAFITSILGLAISILLAVSQKNHKSAVDDELNALSSINGKMDELVKISNNSQEFVEQLKNFRMEVRDEQLKSRNFIEENFTKTNESLEKAIETLARGATEEIIKALEGVIADFNKNLTEQFGENFKQLNAAVHELVTWQNNYKQHILDTEKNIETLKLTFEETQKTIDSIAQRNSETQKVYDQLKSIIETYDAQVHQVNTMLEKYMQIAEKADKAFSKFDENIDVINKNVQNLSQEIKDSVSNQSESLAKLTEDLKKQLPESLGELEQTLTGLTKQFADDYQSFLERYRQLVQA